MVHINDQPINEDHNAPGGSSWPGLGRYHGEWIVREPHRAEVDSVQGEERDYFVSSNRTIKRLSPVLQL